ncbi:MAG: hypothetical protein WC612_03960 [Bdellovibrionales bacterium]|jgi:hypothetical protein
MKVGRFQFLLLALLVGALGACSSYQAGNEQPPMEPQVFPFVRLSPSPPPPSPIEVRPEMLNPMQQVWRSGYWSYDGFTFSWVEGSYIFKPNPTAAWTPDRWEHRTFGWAFIPGYWQ